MGKDCRLEFIVIPRQSNIYQGWGRGRMWRVHSRPGWFASKGNWKTMDGRLSAAIGNYEHE